MGCPECDRLKTEHLVSLKKYGSSIVELNSSAFSPDPEEYNRIRVQADDARIEAEVARLLLAQHRLSHVK